MNPATIARRDDAFLVVVDIQERLAVAMERREDVVAAVSRLVRTAALVGMPILVTRQYPKGLGDLDPGLAAVLDAVREQGARVVVADKLAFDCFGETGFVHELACSGRTQIVLCGMETHICITQTALMALSRDYDVHVVADACCSRADDAHKIALARLRASGAAVTVTESVMYELVGAAGTDEFRSLLAIVKD